MVSWHPHPDMDVHVGRLVQHEGDGAPDPACIPGVGCRC